MIVRFWSLKMETRKSKKDRRKRGEFVPTSVKGIRAENAFWDKCDKVASEQGTTRNDLIVSVVGAYFEKVNGSGK